jgi:hypothetical protein
MTEATGVTVVEDPQLSDGFVVLVEGGHGFMDAIHDAAARVKLLVGDGSPVIPAAIAIHKATWQLARSRATYERGNVPSDLVHAARDAEDEFIRVAHQDLAQLAHIPGSSS